MIRVRRAQRFRISEVVCAGTPLKRHGRLKWVWLRAEVLREKHLEKVLACGRVDLVMNIRESGTTDTGRIHRPTHKASAPVHARTSRHSARVTPTELSGWIQKAKSLPEVRQDLVERVKREIADGTYETPEKIQIAAERMLEEF